MWDTAWGVYTNQKNTASYINIRPHTFNINAHFLQWFCATKRVRRQVVFAIVTQKSQVIAVFILFIATEVVYLPLFFSLSHSNVSIPLIRMSFICIVEQLKNYTF